MSTRVRRPLTLSRKLAFSALSTVAGLLLVEALSRLALIGLGPEERERVLFTSPVVWAHEKNPLHTPDPELFWKPTPGYSAGEVRINRRGTRGPDFLVPKPTGLFRIVLLGDSVTFGFNVPEELSYARRLESSLRESWSRSSGSPREVEVINAGVIGYTSWQGRKLLERSVGSWDSDLVIVLFGYNDHHSSRASDRERSLDRGRAMVLGRLARETSTARLFERLRRLWWGSGLPDRPVPRVGVEEFTDNILALSDEALAGGSAILFLTVPIRPRLPLVENFREVRVREGASVRTVWMRQIDVALQAFEGAAETLRGHFFGGADLSEFTRHPEHCTRTWRLAEGYRELPVFHYLAARCYQARGETEKAAIAMSECARLDDERREVEAYNERLRRLAKASKIQVLDTALAFGEEAGLFLDVVHPSPEGHRRIADAISAYLESVPPDSRLDAPLERGAR
jgi:lysophospholipase L1-like esterase